MILSLSLGFIISLALKFFFSEKIKNQENIEEKQKQGNLIYCEENHSVNSFTNLKKNADEISLVNYGLTIFIIITIAIYFISLPYALCLFIDLLRDKNYGRVGNFFALYFFVLINAIAGGVLIYVLFIMASAKRNGSFRKQRISLDDANILALREEINRAMKAGQ